MKHQQEKLDKHLSTTVQVDERLDPIQFWNSREQTYPYIAQLACDGCTGFEKEKNGVRWILTHACIACPTFCHRC